MSASNTQQFFVDLGERVGTTIVQAFLAALLATAGAGQIIRVNWFDALGVGVFAGITAVITTGIVWLSAHNTRRSPYLDLVLRTVLTFGQTLLGYIVAAGAISAFAFNWNAALLASAIAAGQALLKALISINLPTVGASTLVKDEAPHHGQHERRAA